MAAFVLIMPGVDAKPQDIRDALRREGVVKGISPKALLEASAGPRGMLYQVAWGIPPAGSASSQASRRLLCSYRESKSKPSDTYQVGPNFATAWRELESRGAVSEGDVVAFFTTPAELPKAVGVTGEEIPYIHLVPRSKLGPNTKLTPDGMKVVATRPGIPYVDDSSPSVLDHVLIEGDVSNATGNLFFPGDLTVRGDIRAGFSVSVSGDLLVSGHVWGSATAKGKIVVAGGISAPGEIVESGTGIACKFCENSVIRSKGPISVQEAALHSVIETDDYVQLSAGKGRVVGGVVRATLGLIASTIGTPIGVPTVVELGISPKLRREVDRMERELEKVSANLTQSKRSGSGRLAAFTAMDRARMMRERQYLEEQETTISAHLKILRNRLDGMPQGFLRSERILPGTRLTMGTKVHEFTSVADSISMGVKNA